MVKGISRQVIVMQSPDRQLFEQAIFILRENASAVTDEQLLKEARLAIRSPGRQKKGLSRFAGLLWACGGAFLTGLIWLLTSML